MSIIIGVFVLLTLIGIAFMISRSPIRSMLSSSKIRVAFAAYFIILLISAGVFLYISGQANSGYRIANDKDIHPVGELMDAAKNGNIENVNPDWLVRKWKRDFPYQELNIQSYNKGTPFIIVDQTVELKGKIEASLYKTDTVVHGIVIPADTIQNRIQFSGNQLTYVIPQTHLKYAFAGIAFPFKQFRKQGSRFSDRAFFFGAQLLYLRVPKNVRVTGADVMYVNKNSNVQG